MWKNLLEKIKDFFLNILFPRFCLNCRKEGSYLCQDCQAILEISEYQYCLCPKPKRVFKKGKCSQCCSNSLSGLYFALPYQNNLIKNLIQKFKYEPFIKELAIPLSSLIISHFQCLENKPDFFYPVSPAPKLGSGSNGADFIIIPVPLSKKRLKWRGFNQSEEIGKEFSRLLNIPLINDALIKIKETPPQVELSEKEREENIKGVFLVKNNDKIYPVRESEKLGNTKDIDFSNGVKGKKILLVDDVYTTGSTMKECAQILKEVGVKEVWGVAIARG